MIIILQYSFTDIRRFSQKKETILSKPFWLSPTPYSEFIRGVGPIIPRNRGGLQNWINEKYICKINRGIIVEKIQFVNESGKYCSIFCKHKHIYSDGVSLTKFEFVFETETSFEEFDSNYLSNILKLILKCNIKIIDKNYKYKEATIGGIFKPLLDLYALHTTKNVFLKENYQEYLSINTPQVFIYLQNSEKITFVNKQPTKLKTPKIFPLNIYSWEYKLKNNPLKFWLCEYKDHFISYIEDKNIEDARRKIRISLLRYYCEHQSLKNVLLALTNNLLNITPLSNESDDLQFYFKRILDNIKLEDKEFKENSGIDSLITFICDDYLKYNSTDFAQLIQRIKELNFRPQIEKLIINHIQNFQHMENKIKIGDGNSGLQLIQGSDNVSNITQTNQDFPEGFDWNALFTQLGKLKEEMKSQAISDEDFAQVGKVIEAQKAAEEKSPSKTINALKSFGSWAVEFASKIGVTLVTDLIKKNM